MGWLWDVLTRTPRYKGKNCWYWAGTARTGHYVCGEPTMTEAFRAMGPRAAQSLIQSVRYLEDWECYQGGAILAEMGVGLVPYLVRTYLHDSSASGYHCGQTLMRLGSAAVEGLFEALGAGKDPVKAVPVVLRALGGMKHIRHSVLCWALHELGAAALLPVLPFLSDRTLTIRSAAVQAVGYFCTSTDNAQRGAVLDGLLAAWTDPDDQVRGAAKSALARFRSPEVTASLVEAASRNEAARARIAAVEVLAQIALEAQPAGTSSSTEDRTRAVAGIPAAASAHDQGVREAAIHALQEIETACERENQARRKEEERAKRRAASTPHRCSKCDRLFRPLPVSVAEVLTMTRDELEDVLFQCTDCNRLLCGKCRDRWIQFSCPLCQEGCLAAVEDLDWAAKALQKHQADEALAREIASLYRAACRLRGTNPAELQHARYRVIQIWPTLYADGDERWQRVNKWVAQLLGIPSFPWSEL